MLTLKNVVLSILFVCAVGLSGWSILVSKKNNVISVTKTTNQPDAIMENVIATIINKEGNLALKIESPKMVHFAENNTTNIDKPHITIFRQSPQPWYVDSNYAKATQGTEKIFFWDHVVIHHPSAPSDPTTTLKTASLTVFPHKQLAQTNDAVTFLQPSAIVQAVGMFANLNDGTIKLLSQARGEYVPNF